MTIARRELLGAAALGAILADGAAAAPRRKQGPEGVRVNTGVRCETASGSVAGFERGGVRIFLGLPYSATLTAAHRFGSPPPLAPWTGVRRAYNYGPTCPSEERQADESTSEWPFLLQRGPITLASEDCLRVNVWAPEADAPARPVMIWLHAQGFGGGSSQHFLATNGENLAREQDVVVVSLNHRTGVLGFADVSGLAGGDPDAGNVGMLDIVAALRWVRDHIAAFGGDPGNVTLFGQSGGGFKISVLLAMPAARGLFHKAIIQSGARPFVHERASGRALADAWIEALDIGKTPDLAALRALPVSRLLDAAGKASAQIQRIAARPRDLHPPAWYWQPVAGVPSLPDQPFGTVPSEISRDIPLLVGTTRHEFPRSVDAPEAEAMTWDALTTSVARDLGERAALAVTAARSDNPGASPVEVAAILSGRHFRMGALHIARLRAAAGHAPSWTYIFDWRTPLLEGRPRAYHGAEVPFIFANTDLCDQATGGGERPRHLARVMAGTWARFARTGSPVGRDLPVWQPFSPAAPSAMIFDDVCRIDPDPDPALRSLLLP